MTELAELYAVAKQQHDPDPPATDTTGEPDGPA